MIKSKLLNKTSLASTIENINQVYFYKKDFKKYDVDETVKWILTRYKTEYSYNGSFGITVNDWNSDLRTFTGERLTSPASLRHIHAQEAGRALNILKKYTSLKMPRIKVVVANFKAFKPLLIHFFLECHRIRAHHMGVFKRHSLSDPSIVIDENSVAT